MGYYSNEAVCEDFDREYVDPKILDKKERSFSKNSRKICKPEVKHTYIFKAEGREMYYGNNGPVFNHVQAKRFVLTESEAKSKERNMGRTYLWKAICVSS